MHGAQISVLVIAINIKKSKIEPLFESTLQTKFIGCLKVIELAIPDETLVIEELAKKSLNNAVLDDLKFETFSGAQEF
jgi:hypothetical protein